MEHTINVKTFLEKCQSIHGKNFLCFNSSNSLVPLTLQIFSKRGDTFEKFLTSIPLECGTCPSWTVYGLRSVAEVRGHLETKEILIKVVGHCNSIEVLYFEELFRLDELFIIETSNRSLFPNNFLSFQFNGVRCTSQRLALAFARLSTGTSGILSLNNNVSSSSSANTTTAQTLVPFTVDWEDDGRPSGQQASSVTKTVSDIDARIHKRHILLENYQQLSEKNGNKVCDTALRVVALDRLQERHDSLAMNVAENASLISQLQPRHKQSSEKLETLMRVTDTLAKNIRFLQARCDEKQRHYVQLKYFIESRQMKLFRDILVVYPITQGKSGEYSIRGIELPYDLNSVKDEESLSSGLGYLVHVLLLLSKYWEIPLRYQLLYHGSRCLVRDLAASSAAMIYPLFRHYNDKERFEKGVFWLRIDLEQILQTRGVTFDNARSLLANLMQLQSCDVCPSLAY